MNCHIFLVIDNELEVQMNIPASSHGIWADLLMGKKRIEFEFLPIKMTIGRLQVFSRSEQFNLTQSAEELRTIFVKNQNLPKVQNDIKKLFG